jgi:hypothetical protein
MTGLDREVQKGGQAYWNFGEHGKKIEKGV